MARMKIEELSLSEEQMNHIKRLMTTEIEDLTFDETVEIARISRRISVVSGSGNIEVKQKFTKFQETVHLGFGHQLEPEVWKAI